MENLEASTYEQYIPESESNSEYDTDSDDSDRVVQTHNIGYHNVHHDREHTFLNDTKMKDYETSRNDLFTPALSYDNIVIDSRNHTDDSGTSRSSYVVKFDDEDQTTNKTEGYGTFKNVIGFKLIKANIPSRIYNVDTHNNTLVFEFGGVSKTITLTPSYYTHSELATHLAAQMNAASGVSSVSVAYSSTTKLFTISHSGTTIKLIFSDHSETNMIHTLLGFNKADTVAATTLISGKASILETHFVDLVIPEIPYIACKKNATGKHLIDRIPINTEDGSMNYYVQAADYDKMSYFYPFDLHKITIQLYDESNQGLYTSNTDHFFEFELTMLNNPSLL
jgi:hypothetical protein